MRPWYGCEADNIRYIVMNDEQDGSQEWSTHKSLLRAEQAMRRYEKNNPNWQGFGTGFSIKMRVSE